jgi:hypothetical protein
VETQYQNCRKLISISIRKFPFHFHYLPGAEDVSAVAAVMSALSQREFHATLGAHFNRVVAEPMVGHAPRMDATAGVAHQNSSIVPFFEKKQTNKIRTFHSNDFVLILKCFTWKWPEMVTDAGSLLSWRS